jgi:hypothetical protein
MIKTREAHQDNQIPKAAIADVAKRCPRERIIAPIYATTRKIKNAA